MPIKRPVPKGKTLKRPAKITAPKPVLSTKLQVFDVRIEDLVDASFNPNEQDEATFDQLVEGIRTDGFDEPLIVVPMEHEPGKFMIVSGHHRKRAAAEIGMETVPCVIREGWNEDKQMIEVVRRNQLKGVTNPEKFTAMFDTLSKKRGYDREMLKTLMGFTKTAAFDRVYKEVKSALPPAQQKKLEDAKERITSVDGLTSVLHDIFKEKGTDLEHGFLVFNYANKTHHYVEVDKSLDSQIHKLEQHCRDHQLDIREVFKSMLRQVDLTKLASPVKVDAVASKLAPKRLKVPNGVRRPAPTARS